MPIAATSDEAGDLQRRQNVRRLWHLFWSMTRPFISYAPRAKLDFLWVISLILLRSAFIVAFSFIGRDFWTALQHKDADTFWRMVKLFVALLFCALPSLVWCDYAQQRLSLKWRRWLTEKVVTDYFAQRNYYHLDQDHGKIDNPDQRMSQDVESFTTTSLSFFYKIFRAVVDLFNFSAILFAIYPQLFVVLLVYSAIGSAIVVTIGRRLIHLNFRQLKKEADFRYALIRVRENAESIAFYRGEDREKVESFRRFNSVFLNKISLINWTRNLTFFSEIYTYLVGIIPLVVIAPLYFNNTVEMGVVSQVSEAFFHILTDLSIIVNEFDSISAFSAGIDRLGELEEFMYQRFASVENRQTVIRLGKNPPEEDKLNRNAQTRPKLTDVGENTSYYGSTDKVKDDIDVNYVSSTSLYSQQHALDKFRRFHHRQSLITHDSKSYFDIMDRTEAGLANAQITTFVNSNDKFGVKVKALTLITPNVPHERVLFEDVSFSLEAGKALLIAGPSGTGKSSLLRAIAGLWVDGRGIISRPPLSKIFFLPQKPYCTLGTLREQLVYPASVKDAMLTVSDADLLAALETANLSELPVRMGGLDVLHDWANILSLGEQQRLAFARLIVGKPSLAILDECSSALDVSTEQRLYAHLHELGISFISVGHRPTLLDYHDFILRLGGDLKKSFSFQHIDESSFQQT